MITSALSSIVPRFLLPLTGAAELEETYRTLQSANAAKPLTERLLDLLEVRYQVSPRDLQCVPSKGAAVVVANHPFGILEGSVLAAILRGVRSDVRILANGVLAAIPELRDLVIPVDVIPVDPGGRVRNTRGLREAIEHLAGGGLLVVFPAGEVSHFQWSQRRVTDPEWSTSVVRLIETAARRGSVPVAVPVYIAGANSFAFQAAGMLHPRLRTALLARELFNKRQTTVDVRIGAAIDGAKLLAIATPEERTEYLRWRTYLLENRQVFAANTARPLRRDRTPRPAQIAPPVDATAMASEIDALTPLATSGDLSAYIAPAAQIPRTLDEIGRLREIAFRAAGEGTGKPRDLDRFDPHYQHLFLWNRRTQEIAGAYRICGSEAGPEALYTATLFPYGQSFLDKIGPALELGRSFVRPEYQKGFAPLLLLWKGIGAYIAQNPRYKVLFGPVSISNQYQSISRELMVTFLERHASLKNLANLVTQRNPFRVRRSTPALPAATTLDDLSGIVADLEPNQAGVPVLLRQYLRLGGKLLGFNVDPEFANALDGLILVDLTQTEPQLLDRYLGKREAAAFLQFQKGL